MNYDHLVRRVAWIIQTTCRISWDQAKEWACLMGVARMKAVRLAYIRNKRRSALIRVEKDLLTPAGRKRDKLDSYIRRMVRAGKQGHGTRDAKAA